MDLPTTHYDEPRASKKVEETRIKTGGDLLRKIAIYILLVAVFFAPLIFIPSGYAPLDVVKAVFIGVCVLVAGILLAIDMLRNPKIVVTPFSFSYAALAVGISILLSSLLSSNIPKSFMGQGFELGTASFLLIMLIAMWITKYTASRDSETIFKIYSVFFLSVSLLIIFHLIRMFGGADILKFGVLNTVTTTIVGKWYDFASLVGALAILSLLGGKFLPLRKGLKKLLLVAFVICLIVLFLVNSGFIWGTMALVTIGLMMYEYSIRPKKGTGFAGFFSRISIYTLIVLVLSLVFVWKGNQLVAPIMSKLNTQYVEAALPWQLTLDVAADTLKESPVLGAGPNRFGYQYLKFKPLSVNTSQFWNSEFPNGFGLLPTFLVTQGILGLIVWALFFIFFIREGVRALRKTYEPLARFLLSSSFFTALFLWIIAFLYVPSHVTIFFTFVFTGIYVAALVKAGMVREKEIAVRTGRYGKMVLLGVSVCTILLVVWLGAYAKKAVALTYFQKGIKILSVNKSPDMAETYFKKALVWDTADVYYQALSENNILKINTLTQQMQAEAQNGTPDQAKVEKVINLITDSIKYSKSAEKLDPNNYYNYIAEAHISEIGTSLKLPNAYDNAKAAYASSLKTNPANPATYLSLARLEASQSKFADAERDVGTALQLKPNYTEAVFFLSQLQVAENKLNDAIVSTQVAISLNPGEPLLYFQLGLLEYNNKDYTTAIAALQKAVDLNNQYANARYFLGLAQARLGNNEKATEQFAELMKTNPDNKEISFILTNLREGRSPFADAQPPIDSKPEKRKTLPVAEKPTTTKPVTEKTEKATPSPSPKKTS